MRTLRKNDLQLLDDFLAGVDRDDCMPLSELDGLIAGVVVSPNLIRPNEWIPVIWGSAGPAFNNGSQANEIVGLIMARYNEIVRALSRKREYVPILEKDNDGTFMWELWASGFAKALELGSDGWALFEKAKDKAIVSAFGAIKALAEMAENTCRLSEEADRELREKPQQPGQYQLRHQQTLQRRHPDLRFLQTRSPLRPPCRGLLGHIHVTRPTVGR